MRVDSPTLRRLIPALGEFLLSVRDGKPQAERFLGVEQRALEELYARPDPRLIEAVRQCLEVFLVDLEMDPSRWGVLKVPVEVLGLAWAAMNVTVLGQQESTREVVASTRALVQSLPPVQDRTTALIYHAILRDVVRRSGPGMLAPSKEIVPLLLDLSPISAWESLDFYLPPALEPLAVEWLPGWKSTVKVDPEQAVGWQRLTVALLKDAVLARWIRQRWLALSETRIACRNLGLMLEGLRRSEVAADFLFQFYESYCHFCGEMRVDAWGKAQRVWPLLEMTEKFLRVPGGGPEALQAARIGNDYFLKFRPLVALIIAGGGVPANYNLLSAEFVLALQAILPYVTEQGKRRIEFGAIQFEGGNDHGVTAG